MKEELKQLIKFKTLSKDTKENERALEWIISKIPKSYKTEIKNYNGHPALFIGGNSPALCLQAHIDVVPGTEDSFDPKEIDGKIYGRGTYDMKFAIASYIDILNNIDPDKHNIGVLITSDEEIGGFNGVAKAIENGYSPEFVFLPDGGDNWEFDIRAKGAYHFTIKTKGVSGHASRPWEGVSAICKLIDIINELKAYFPKPEEGEFQSSINIGKIEGGEATNQIAEDASCNIDIRFTTKEEEREIKEKLKEIEDKYKEVEIIEDIYAPLFESNPESSYFKEFEKIAREYNKEISKGFAHGASDARHFHSVGIPTMVIKPKGGGTHSKEEWVDIRDVEQFSRVVEEFARKITKKRA